MFLLDHGPFLNFSLPPLRRGRASVLLSFLSGGFYLVTACSGDSSSTQEEADPPVLEILGAQNAEGDEFDFEEDEVGVSCDSRLTVLLGPNSLSTPGLLDNWELRPPGNCGDSSKEDRPCGFILLQLLDSNDDVLREIYRASTAPVIDLRRDDVDTVAQIRAQLIYGRTGEDYLVDGELVVATWNVRMKRDNCDDLGLGGAGAEDADLTDEEGNPVTDQGGAGGAG